MAGKCPVTQKGKIPLSYMLHTSYILYHSLKYFVTIQIYDAQPEISTIFQTAEVIALPRLLSMIMVVSLPPVCNKPFFTQGLSVSD